MRRRLRVGWRVIGNGDGARDWTAAGGGSAEGRESRLLGAEGWSSSHSSEEMARRREPMRGRGRDWADSQGHTRPLVLLTPTPTCSSQSPFTTSTPTPAPSSQSLSSPPASPTTPMPSSPASSSSGSIHSALNSQLSPLLMLLSLSPQFFSWRTMEPRRPRRSPQPSGGHRRCLHRLFVSSIPLSLSLFLTLFLRGLSSIFMSVRARYGAVLTCSTSWSARCPVPSG